MLKRITKFIQENIIDKSALKKTNKDDFMVNKIREVINSEQFSKHIEANNLKSKKLNDNFNASFVENQLNQLFQKIYTLKKETYSTYEVRKGVEYMVSVMDEMVYYYDRDEWKDLCLNAFDTQFFKYDDADKFLPAEMGKVYSKEPNEGERLIKFHINIGLLQAAKRVEFKNYELLKEYKRKDRIRERFETIVSTAKLYQSILQTADNKMKIYQDLRVIISRAEDRGKLNIKEVDK